MSAFNKTKDKNKRKGGVALTFKIWMVIIASVMFAAIIVALAYGLTDYFFKEAEVIIRSVSLALILLGESLVVSSAIVVPLLGRFLLAPMNKLVSGLNEIANGDYTKRISVEKQTAFKPVFDNFNTMARELNATETLRNDFVHNFSHEFKTPIVSIQGFAKLLKNPNLSESERSDYLDIILDESKRLVDLSNNSLMLTKLETQLQYESTPYFLDEQIRQCVLQFEELWSLKNLEMDIDLDEIEFTANGDVIKQMWLNLISNAIKFSNDQSKIIIRLKKLGDVAEFTITDFGCGISAAAMPHIFDKYYQEDTSHLTEGNGLGLPIVNTIVKMIGGKIEVESEKGKGTTFKIIMPL